MISWYGLYRRQLRAHMIIVCCLWGVFSAFTQEVTVQRDGSSWSLNVNGKPFFIKGMCWSYAPIGAKYDYDLFRLPEDHIKRVIERDFSLMKAMGCNTVRASLPPKWTAYIHRKYGIWFIPNYYCGRYGMTVNGKWTYPTNYEDPQIRRMIIEEARSFARRYHKVPGVLMLAWGNENNYGLEWKSAEAENLPVGERHKAKAKFIYTLFNAIIEQVRGDGWDKPQAIVNGEIQYLDLIRQYCPAMDVFSLNCYRGRGYGPLAKDIAAKLGKPFFLMETGCDAWNARTHREDQDAQADTIAANWEYLYRQAPGVKGGAMNCLGAVVFQWADEWWKRGQQHNLWVHDTEGSWAHGAYYDAGAGVKNMNEEWFGICAIHPTTIDGVHVITPRVSYFVLKAIWSHDPIGHEPATITGWFRGFGNLLKTRKKQAAKRARLPLVLYAEGESQLPYIPSGFMGNTAAMKLDLRCQDRPYAGTYCARFSYNATSGWGGVVWQNPQNNWGDENGGYNLTGARFLEFAVRGKTGGQTVTFFVGLVGKDKPFGDSCKREVKVILSTQWQKIRIPLENAD
ncbi:MAG: hypothetical protein D6820_03225, partial [Lentisphaerae bacterium]